MDDPITNVGDPSHGVGFTGHVGNRSVETTPLASEQITQADVTDVDKAAVTRFHAIQLKRLMAGDRTMGENRDIIEQAFARHRIEAQRASVWTDEQLTALAQRFCATPLPESVCADLVAIKPMPGRYGTNLLTVAQAKEMLAAALSASPAPSGQEADDDYDDARYDFAGEPRPTPIDVLDQRAERAAGNIPAPSGGVSGQVRVHKTDGDYVVADDSGWLPGVYPSEAMARAAASVPHDVLSAWWESLASPAPSGQGVAGEVGYQLQMTNGAWTRVLVERSEAEEAVSNPANTITAMRPVYLAAPAPSCAPGEVERAEAVERVKAYIAELLLTLQPFASAAERAQAENEAREGPTYNGPLAYPWNYVDGSHFADAFAMYSERLDPDDLAALSPQGPDAKEGGE